MNEESESIFFRFKYNNVIIENILMRVTYPEALRRGHWLGVPKGAPFGSARKKNRVIGEGKNHRSDLKSP